MQKEYIQVHFTNSDAQTNELIIALLSDTGFSGFEETEGGLKAFAEASAFEQDLLDKTIGPLQVSYELSTVQEENWNAAWEKSFEPIVVDDFCAIRASFHAPVPGVEHDIVITPKMSFGTGHHATTYMMIGQMRSLEFAGRTVVDFGTGTAVLAILAEKIGASHIDAIDNDDWSIENAGENLAANDCKRVEVLKGETLLPGKEYDVVLANINLNVIRANFEAILTAAKPGADILLSGFLLQDEATLLALAGAQGLTHVDTRQKGEWICLKFKLN